MFSKPVPLAKVTEKAKRPMQEVQRIVLKLMKNGLIVEKQRRLILKLSSEKDIQ